MVVWASPTYRKTPSVRPPFRPAASTVTANVQVSPALAGQVTSIGATRGVKAPPHDPLSQLTLTPCCILSHLKRRVLQFEISYCEGRYFRLSYSQRRKQQDGSRRYVAYHFHLSCLFLIVLPPRGAMEPRPCFRAAEQESPQHSPGRLGYERPSCLNSRVFVGARGRAA